MGIFSSPSIVTFSAPYHELQSNQNPITERLQTLNKKKNLYSSNGSLELSRKLVAQATWACCLKATFPIQDHLNNGN